LAECEARELLSDGELTELSLWSKKKGTSKQISGRGEACFLVGKGF